MSIVFDYVPPELMASKNPIAIIVREEVAEGFTKVACRLYVETVGGSGNFQLVHTEIRDYDRERKVVFRLETILDSELEMESYHFERDYAVNLVDGTGNPPPQQGKAVKRYMAIFQEGNAEGLDLTNHELLLQNRYAIKAHRTFEDYNHLTNFPEGVLSHQPATRSHYPGQHHWLWLLSATNPKLQVAWKAMYEGQPTVSGIIDYGVHWGKYLPRGIPLHLYWHAREQTNLVAMEFAFPETDFPAIKLVRAFEGLTLIREFHFDNQQGGFDQFIAYGKAQREDRYSATTAMRFLAHDYPDHANHLTSLARQTVRHNDKATVQLKAQLGYREESQRDAARAIFLSAQAFERRAGKFLPITITSTKLKLNADGDYRYGMEFTYQYAFENAGLWL